MPFYLDNQIVPARRRSLSNSGRDVVRRQLYEERQLQDLPLEEEVYSKKQEINPPHSSDPLQQSPSSLKVSISKDNLKDKEYSPSSKRRILVETAEVGELENETGRPINNYRVKSRKSEDGSTNQTASNRPPTDVLITAPEQVMRPVIPKIIVKKVRRKEGSKEFETMEIITPEKEILHTVEISNEEVYDHDEVSSHSTSELGEVRATRKKRRRLSSDSEASDGNFTDNLHKGEYFSIH